MYGGILAKRISDCQSVMCEIAGSFGILDRCVTCVINPSAQRSWKCTQRGEVDL